LLILIAGNNAPLAASLAASEAQLRGFSATAGTSGAAAGGALRGVAVAAGLTAGATAIAAAASINAAADFQDQLAIINTIAHQAPEELNRTGEAIRAMAVSSGEPLETLAQGFYNLLSAGVPASQAMSVLQSSTTLAIGGLATTAQTVDLLTTAMNAYGLTTAGVAVATDQFARAVQDGKVTADQIAATFADVAPIARQSGIGIDEIAAAYATLTARGVPAAEVTTQMNRAIIELLKPSTELRALQEQLHINFANIASEQGLVVALQAMRDAATEAGVPFQDLFGRLEGLKFALATTGPNFQAYRAELGAMFTSAGTAGAQAEERMGTFNRQVSILGNSLRDLAIAIGTGFLPQVTGLVQTITSAVQGVSAWAAANPGLANTILVVVGGATALVAVVGIIGTALGAILSPIGLVVAAVVALGIAWTNNFLGIRNIVQAVFGFVSAIIGRIVELISGAIAGLKSLIDQASKAAEAVGKIKPFGETTYRDVGPFHLPEFQTGGVVPGVGPQMAIVHGGETITPAGQAAIGGPGQATGQAPINVTIHSVIELEGEKIGEIVERRLFNSASGFTSGFVGSPQTT
jgi:TP901 family phage tail tape measure protein